jgi:hypothetical protein
MVKFSIDHVSGVSTLFAPLVPVFNSASISLSGSAGAPRVPPLVRTPSALNTDGSIGSWVVNRK